RSRPVASAQTLDAANCIFIGERGPPAGPGGISERIESMRAALLALGLLFCAQDESYRILQDPARRAKEFDRQTALKAFREHGKDNAAAWVAARFLEKSERQWKLTYDRLKTGSGVLLGTADGATFVATNGTKV